MDCKITVISPCFNAENTLKRTIESIINQSIGFDNIELILYDDASTDNTKKIIQYFADKYENIVPVFSNSNLGPGTGKDLCIPKAKGEYIMFIDSDDEYNKRICETLLKEMDDNIDIVSCNHMVFEDDSSEICYYKFSDDYNLKNKSFIQHDELIYLPSFNVVDKMFKREIIIKNNIRFTSLRNGEDEVFLRHYLLYAKNLVHLNNYVGYKIHKQKDSISGSQTIEDLQSYILTCLKIKEIYEHENVDIPRLLGMRINAFIELLYIKDILKNYDKNRLYTILNNLADLEEEISFNQKLGLLNDITNFFIKRKQFALGIVYSKILYNIRKSKLLVKLWRIIN